MEKFSEEREYILFTDILNQAITFTDLAPFISKPKTLLMKNVV